MENWWAIGLKGEQVGWIEYVAWMKLFGRFYWKTKIIILTTSK